MNLYSIAIDAVEGFLAHHRAPRVVKQKTYVFLLVPVDCSKDGDVKKGEVTQGPVEGHGDFDRVANYLPRTGLAPVRDEIGCVTDGTSDADKDNEPELDFRLMWTWHLPNPLWKLKRRR